MPNERSPTQEAADQLKTLRSKVDQLSIDLVGIEQMLTASAWKEEMFVAKKAADEADESFAYDLVSGDDKPDRQRVITTPAILANSVYLIGLPLGFAVAIFVVISLQG